MSDREERQRLRDYLDKSQKQGRGFHNDPNGDRAKAIESVWRKLPREDK